MPSVLPLISKIGNSSGKYPPDRIQPPSLTKVEYSATRWKRLSIYANTVSATASVEYVPALQTVILCLRQYSVSMVLYPVANVPMYLSLLACERTSASSIVLFIRIASASAIRLTASDFAVIS